MHGPAPSAPNAPDSRSSRLIWLAFAVAFAFLAWQFQDSLENLFQSRGTLSVERETDRVVLSWRGKVDAPMAQRIEEAFRSHAGETRRFVLSLHSPGGSLEHGREVIRIIKGMQRTHDVDTVVERRNACASMCVPIYLAGHRRTADRRARFMFHEVSFRESVSEEKAAAPKIAIERATDSFFARDLAVPEVNAEWLKGMRRAIRGKDVWRTGEQLMDERAGIVQQLL